VTSNLFKIIKLNDTGSYLPKIFLISLIFFVARIVWVVFYNTDLFSEEAQYWLWSKNLSYSYYSKPPLIAFVNLLSTSVLGNTEIGVRINAIIIGFILPILVYRFAYTLFNNHHIAFTSAFILLAMPFYHYVSLFFTTDSLVTLFWLLTMMYFYAASEKNKLNDWIWAGIFLGLAIMSKYTALLFYPVAFLYVLFFKKYLFKNKGLYVFAAVSVILCIPILFWTITYESVNLKHVFTLMSGPKQTLSVYQGILNILEYIGGQILILSPLLLLPACIFVLRKKGLGILKPYSLQIRYLFFPLLFVWLFFLPIAYKKIGANWLSFAYATAPIPLGYLYGKFFRFRYLNICMGVTLVLVVFMLNPVLFDSFGMSNVYSAKNDAMRRMYGWKGLGEKVSGLIKDSTDTNVFIVSNNYHIASQLAFYTVNNPQTYCINTGRRMNQFDLWPGLEQFENKGYDAIYVSKGTAPQELLDSFEKQDFYTHFTVFYRNTHPVKFHIYLLKGFKEFDDKKPDTF
jgi:4-amino-4-deoxy-L-arabinose transferase-like glycosyltransferase